MSIISNIHTATVYEAKGANQTKPFEGQRLVVTIAKADKNGNYGQHLQQTMATSIPQLTRIDIDFSLASVQDACVEYFKTVQNSIVNARIKEGNKTVTTEQLHISAIIDFINAESSGDKWDAQRVANWFQSTMAEHIGVALIEKGYDDSKLDASLKAYEKLISETMSSKAVITRKKAEAISKAFKLVPSEDQDAIFSRFQARIDKVLIEDNLDEMFGL